ncbi:MAG: hypothetical protein GY696_00450 [Gammaproteobacteria bacterium]|nr:hypothetical protein [Gammaproteobacteria bacterium]
MQKLINMYVDICLLRAKPQDLPGSMFLVWLTAALGMVSGAVVVVTTMGGVGPALLVSFIDLLLIAVLLRLGLQFTHKIARFEQTLAALFGSAVLINLLTMPIQRMIKQDPSTSIVGDVGLLFYLALVIWALVIMAHIIRHAFDIRFSAGVMISIGYFLLISFLIQSFFPAPAG